MQQQHQQQQGTGYILSQLTAGVCHRPGPAAARLNQQPPAATVKYLKTGTQIEGQYRLPSRHSICQGNPDAIIGPGRKSNLNLAAPLVGRGQLAAALQLSEGRGLLLGLTVCIEQIGLPAAGLQAITCRARTSMPAARRPLSIWRTFISAPALFHKPLPSPPL